MYAPAVPDTLIVTTPTYVPPRTQTVLPAPTVLAAFCTVFQGVLMDVPLLVSKPFVAT